MKEIKFEELTTKQKLGMTYVALLNAHRRTKEDDEFIFDLIKNRSLGGVWIYPGEPEAKEMMERVKATADYPILIFTDAESGLGDFIIGRHNPIGCTDNEEYAYVFGKAVGVTARKMGYNIVCNPLLDMSDEGNVRCLGTDKEKVAKLAAAEARGMHDAGILTLGKHYPGGQNPEEIDSHMAESVSPETKEDLIESSLYPYKKLMDENLLDGIMTGHKRFYNIDPDHPASLSKPVIDIIREMGFNGIAITDAMCMQGITAKFDEVEAKGLAVAAGNDCILPFIFPHRKIFAQLCEAYESGMISDERLDDAVRHVLNAQHKTLEYQNETELTQEEIDKFKKINKDSVYAKVDEGISLSLPRDGKHFFAVAIKNTVSLDAEGKPQVDTFSSNWHFPDKIEKKIKETFPNSTVEFMYEFPTPGNNARVLDRSIGYDETIFLTFTEPMAYIGKEYLTHRMVAVISAMQVTNRVSAVIHFGNPYVLEELPHIPRYIIGGLSEESVNTCIEVLAGEYPANGVPTYDAKLK